jgi:hypothetical protein
MWDGFIWLRKVASFEQDKEPSGSLKCEEFTGYITDYQLLKNDSVPGSTGTGFSPSSSVFPWQYHPLGLHIHVSSSGVTIIGQLVAAVRRRSLTPSTGK